MHIKTSIVIPAYGNWDLVKKNIDSLLYYDNANIAEIIVIDDCSNQSNPYTFDQRVNIYITSENNGYANTTNEGLKRAIGNIIILLDSDACLVQPIVGDILNCFDSDSKLGCIGLKSINCEGKQTGSYQFMPSVAGYILGLKIDSILNKYKKPNRSQILPYSCCVAFRKDCLTDVGILDQETFPILEADNDLSLRILKKEWRITYIPYIIVQHEGGNSYKVNSKRLRMYHEARWNLLRKHEYIDKAYPIRFFLKLRVKIEILILIFLKIVSKNKSTIGEKLEGRKMLYNEISQYT